MKQSDEFYKQKLAKKRHKKKSHGRHRDRTDGMNKVHQDDDYSTWKYETSIIDSINWFTWVLFLFPLLVYPSLMVSDDEEDPSGSWKRGKTAQEPDEAWCPGIKVSKLIPKESRPSRPGAKREAVEKGLSDAATKLASNVSLNFLPSSNA